MIHVENANALELIFTDALNHRHHHLDAISICDRIDRQTDVHTASICAIAH